MADMNSSGRSGYGLYKPGCLFTMAPGILVALLVLLGLLGGWSIGILVAIICAGAVVTLIVWFVNRADRKDIRNEPPPPWNPGGE
jgi:amino acid transporter